MNDETTRAVTIISNVLGLRGSPPEFAHDSAWQIVAALEISGLRIVTTEASGRVGSSA